LYLGIENRFNREYFGRRRDHHSGLWFGSLYPRLVAHLASLVRSHHPYLTFTYSHGGYRRLLADAGLPAARLYGFEPDYRRPQRIVDLREAGQIRDVTRALGGRLRYLPPAVYRWMVPSFAVIAGRQARPASWLEELAGEAAGQLGAAAGEFRIQAVTVNRKNKISLFLHIPGRQPADFVLKIPLVPEVARWLTNNHRVLSALAGRLPPDSPLLALLPQELFRVKSGAKEAFGEAVCQGRPWAEQLDRCRDQAVVRRVASLVAQVSGIEAAAVGISEIGPDLKTRISFLRRLLGSLAADLLPALDRVEERLSPGPELFLRKGDFSLSNTFLDGGKVTGLIDWDESGPTPFPLTALADFLFSYCWHYQRARRSETLAALFQGDFASLPPELAIDRLLEDLGRTREDLAVGTLSSWVDHAYHELKFETFRYSRSRQEELLLRPCRLFIDSA